MPSPSHSQPNSRFLNQEGYGPGSLVEGRRHHRSTSAPDIGEFEQEHLEGMENGQHHAVISLQDEELNVFGYRRSPIRAVCFVF